MQMGQLKHVENNMYEETKEIPNSLKDLHLEVAAITGSPRIAKRNSDEKFSDTYVNIPQEEWESAVLNWANHLEHGYVQVLKDFTFCIAGKAKDKRNLIMGLRSLADELEEIINKQLTEKPLEVKSGEEDE